MENQEKEKPKLQIEINEEIGRGKYANLVIIANSETEFILDFVFVQPGSLKAKVVSRIILAPLQAKRLLFALQDNIRKYEARFGPISLSPKNLGGDTPPSEIIH